MSRTDSNDTDDLYAPLNGTSAGWIVSAVDREVRRVSEALQARGISTEVSVECARIIVSRGQVWID